MNTNDSSLIDEREIRDALSHIRIDREVFGRGVRERVRQATVQPANTNDANRKERGGQLRVAASVLPVNLFGANTAATQASWATVGVVQKTIAYLALPAISILMLAVTVNSWLRIRKAQRSPSVPEADMGQMQESLLAWWRRYGWIATIVFGLTITAPFVGWTTPLLLLFMGSAIGTASIISTLGKAGLVDRNVIGGNCMAMLSLLGQVSLIFATTNNRQLLDPHLVTATFFAGATLLFLIVKQFGSPPSGMAPKLKPTSRIIFLCSAGVFLSVLALLWLSGLKSLFVGVMFCVLALGAIMLLRSIGWPVNGSVVRGVSLVLFVGVTGFIGQSLWRPIDTSALVRHAETFQPRLVGHWSYWQATARWLQDQGIHFDRSTVQNEWLKALNEEGANRSYLLNRAVSTGLRAPSELVETKRFNAAVNRLLAMGSTDTPISSIGQYEYVIVALVEEGTLTNEQRDHLAGRLLASWRSLDDGRVNESLVDAATITSLLSLVDRPLAEAERQADVDRWLGEYQVIDSRPFAVSGGFKRYLTKDGSLPTTDSDLMSTEHAVRLMQHYGTHENVDILALRAFLRPALSDRIVMEHASARTSIRQRLDRIPGIPQPSLWDYVRLNLPLWFAMLLVGLCIYATLGSPQILNEPSDAK